MKRSAIAAICIGLLMFLGAGMQEARAQSDPPQLTTLIVKVAPGVSAADADAAIRRHGGTPKTSIARLGMYVVEVPEADAEAIKKSLEEDPAVARVEVNRSRKLSAIPSDALFASQWALPKMAWNEVYGTVSPTSYADVAILDTGIDAAHPDLIGSIGPGTSFIDDSDGRTDLNGHGTWVAGMVAGRTNNLDGIAGVAYSNVHVLPVKVLDSTGLGQDIDIIQGVLWAADHGASVILMAFSNEGFSQSLQDAIDYAWSRNIVLVAAVGNEGVNTPSFPAGDKGVIGVSATNQNDELAPSSNFGPSVFLAAPGVDIVSTYKGGGYVTWSGSSASAAMVAGAAALMRTVDGTLTNGVVVSRLARTADPAGTQEQTGNGRIQIARALADTNLDEIQPAGTPPVGDGGPFVGPYRAAACTVSSVSVVPQAPAPAAPGQTISYTNITLTKSNGNCDGTWSMTWSGAAPAGTSASFSSATFTGSGTSKTTTLSIATTVGLTPAGTRNFTVSAGGSSDTGGTVTSSNFSFALDKANQTITFGVLADKTYGASDFAVSATASSGLPVSFIASGNCTIATATVHIVSAGSCTVTAQQGGNGTYNAAPDVPRTFSIAKANVSIVISPYTVAYDGNPHTATGSATGVNSEALSGLNLSGTTHSNAGNYPTDPWTFTDVTGNYNNASGTTSDIINKASATILVTGFSGTYDGNAHGVISSSAKGINNEDLTGLVLAATTYTNVPGGNIHWTFTNINYNDQNGDAAVTITKANATMSVTGFSGTYDGNAHGVISSSAKGINNEDLTGLVLAATTYTNVPGGNVHWTFTNINYNDQNGDAAVTITKANATISVTGFSGTYDGNAHGATGSASGVGGVDLSASLNLGATFTDVAGGTAHWTFAGGTNYNDASGDAAITISKADALVSVSGYTGVYDAAAHGATGSASGVGGMNLSASLNLGATFTDVPGGTAHWTFSGGTNYNDQNGDALVTISKADALISVRGYTGVYDAAAHGATGTASGVGGVNLSASLNLGATFTDVPGGTAHWTFSGGTNYNDKEGDVAIAISKATASITVNGYTGIYDAAAHGATGTASGVGGVNLSASLNLGVTFTDVPGGTAHWTFSGGTNYNDQNGDAPVTISKADALISVSGYTGVYDAAAHGATGSASGVGGVNLSASLNLGVTFTDVPGGTAHWTFSGGTNYNDQNGDALVTISKADALISVSGYTGTYDAAAHGATGSASGVGGVNLSASLNLGATFTDVPGGTAHWTFSGGTNYNDQNGDALVTISKADALISVSGYTGVYDAAAHGATGSASGVGGVNLSASLNLGATFTDVPGGTAHWTFSGGTNYNDTSGDVAITISKATASITVNGYTGIYDAAAHGATGSASGVGGVNLSASLNLGATFTDVPGGTAHWTFSGGTNYNDTSGDVAITISKATASITVNGYTGVYDAAAHGATGTASGVGGVNLSASLNLGTTFTDVPGGTAHWAFSGGTNYDDASGNVAITISKADALVSVSGYTGVYDAAAHGATGTASGVGGVNLSASLNLGATFTDVPGGTAHWTFSGGTNYNDKEGDVAIAISKATASITVNGYTGVYDAAAHGATGSASGVGGVNLSASLNLGTTFTNVPGGTAHWAFSGGTNYDDASGNVAITISKADALVSVSGYTGVYDAAAHGATGTASGVGGVNLSASLNLGTTFTDVPGGTAHWTFSGGTNYNDKEGDVAIAISKATASITVNGYTGVYDAAAHGATGSASGVGGVNLSASLNLGATFTDVPGGTAHWTFAGGTNYNDDSGDVAISISKATASITVNGYYGTYNAGAHGATGSASGVGGVNLSASLNLGATFTDVPGGTAHWTFAGGTNYNNASGDVNIHISAASLIITASNKTKTYGAAVTFDTTTPSPDFSVAGLAGSDTVNSITLTSAGAAAGATVAGSPYPITPSAAVGTGLSNYSINYVAGQLKVRYGVCLQYDAQKAYKNGSTIPIKINLCDAAGNNVSSSSVIVTATMIVKLDPNSSPFDAEDSGNANPDSNFRFAGGFYIFNLSLKDGFDKGTYRMSFVVNGQSDPNYYLGFDVK